MFFFPAYTSGTFCFSKKIMWRTPESTWQYLIPLQILKNFAISNFILFTAFIHIIDIVRRDLFVLCLSHGESYFIPNWYLYLLHRNKYNTAYIWAGQNVPCFLPQSHLSNSGYFVSMARNQLFDMWEMARLISSEFRRIQKIPKAKANTNSVILTRITKLSIEEHIAMMAFNAFKQLYYLQMC